MNKNKGSSANRIESSIRRAYQRIGIDPVKYFANGKDPLRNLAATAYECGLADARDELEKRACRKCANRQETLEEAERSLKKDVDKRAMTRLLRNARHRLAAEVRAARSLEDGQAQPTGATIADVVEQWCLYMPSRYNSASHEPSEFRTVLLAVIRLYKNRPVAEFDSLALMEVQRAMADGSWMSVRERQQANAKGRPVGWCRRTVNRAIVRIRTVWRWAESRKLAPPGSWSNLRSVPGLRKNSPGVREAPKSKIPTWDDVKKVLRHLSPIPRAMLLLQWWSGMRTCEVRLMRVADIDRTGDVWLYRPGHHKNEWRGQERVIALGPKCQAVLRAFLEGRDPNAYLFSPAEARTDWYGRLREARRTKVQPSQVCRKKDEPLRKPGEHYEKSSYSRAVSKAGKLAGLEGFHPYSLRHAAKNRITRAAGADAARAVLGHKTISTTQHYGSLDMAHAAEVMGRHG